MDHASFYKDIVKRGVYNVFNELRTGLFGKLATDSHIPISYNKLDEVLAECELPRMLDEFVRDKIDQGDRFRYHGCEVGGVKLCYFVDVTKEPGDKDSVASHLQYWDYDEDSEIHAISAIVLYEKHPSLEPTKYPKIIKHELTHAAIEYAIGNNKELFAYYFSADPDVVEFIEFICDLIPYVSTPSKKENGINRFIADSEECFGYDAEEGEPAEFIKTIIGSMAEGTEEDVTMEEPSYEEFKSLKDKYSFILRKTDGANRCDLLGITKSMYYDKDKADSWYAVVSDILGDVIDDDTKDARSVLDKLYGNMIEA